MCFQIFLAILTGVISGLIAAIIWAAIVLGAAYRRAGYFVGTFEMRDQNGEQPTGGTVRITRHRAGLAIFQGLMDPTQILDVAAEHEGGSSPGTENWRGWVEVLPLSGTASGMYVHPRNHSGTLILRARNSDPATPYDEIVENGTPHTGSEPFTRILRRLH